MRMTLRRRIAIGYTLMTAVMLGAIISGIIGFGSVKDELDEVKGEQLPASDAITAVRVAFLEKGFAHSMIIEGEIEEAEEMWDEADKQFTSMMDKLNETRLINESILSELESMNRDLNKHKDGLVTAYLTGGTEVQDVEAMAKSEAVINSQAMAELDGLIETMSPMFAQLDNQIAVMMDNSIASSQNTMNSRQAMTIGFASFAVFCAVMITIVTTWIIGRPVLKLVDAAARVAGRDLTVDIEPSSGDEIGQLAMVFKAMVQSLRDIVRKVSGTAQGVSFSAQQLASAAQQTNASAQEVASAIEQVARGAQIQAQRVQQTTSVMEDLGASISEGAQSARAAAEASARASESARTGADSVRGSIDTMDEIEDVTGLTAEAVAKLGQRSEQMTEIVELITSIADQTNLLALNAAIEAARAGEAGKGFAVVAEEVRKLAENSASSATEIGKLIRETTRDTEAAVKNMDAAMAKVKTGKVMITSTGAAFDEIVRMSEDVSGMLQKVSDASSEMSTGAEKVIRSAQDVASIAEETSASTEQASASTQEMVATMEEMASAAASLANMGAELNRLVAEFKTGENTGESRPDMTSPVRSPAGSIKKRFEDSRKRMRMPVQLHALKAEEKNVTHSKDGEESDVERM